MTEPLKTVYRNFLDHLSDRERYKTYTVHDFYVTGEGKPDPERVNVILRVDVDDCLHLAAPLAEEMQARGLKASYYFLTHPGRQYNIWGSGVPGKVRELGHEVGLHSDHYYEQIALGKDGLRELKSDILKLSDEAGEEIKGMVYHGHDEIERMGAINWDLYGELRPEELGLAYHDGPASCYTVPGYAVWVPKCDCNLSDFMGITAPGGWAYLPSWPIANLKRLQPGDVCHVTIHTGNAFHHRKDHDSRYGEPPPRKVRAAAFLLNRGKVYFYFILLPAIVRSIRRLFSAAVLVLSYTMTYGGYIFARRRSGEKEPDTTLEAEKRMIYDDGIDYWHGKLREMGLLKKGSSVLEVGSGFGQWLIAFARDAAEVAGIEPNARIRGESLEKIREFGLEERISVLDASAEHIPFPDGRFDVVLCLGVFQFTRQNQALKEISRVLKPGGTLGLAVNGIGYFLMCAANGIKFGRLDITCHGLSGCIATVLKWLTGRDLGFTTGVSGAEMRRRFAAAGLRMKEFAPWVDTDGLPLRKAGFVVNYLFIAVKP